MNLDYKAGAFLKSKLETRFDSKDKKRKTAQNTERTVYKQVDARDDMRCRAYGTKVSPRAVSLVDRAHHHHVLYRSGMGPTTTENVALLSARAHMEIHAGRLHCHGDANKRLTFETPEGKVWHSYPPNAAKATKGLANRG